MRQTVLWTALPAGRTMSGGLRLSVLVSPQLFPEEEPNAALSNFPDFAAWSETPVRFAVRFGSGERRTATVISPAPRPDLWRALLPPQTQVNTFTHKRFDNRRIHSYPVAPVKAYFRGQYEVIAAAHPQEPPGLEVYSGMAHAIGAAAVAAESATEHRDAPRWAYGQARGFLTDLRRRRPEPAAQTLDFHQLIASVGPYPAVLRQLGLVYDLEIAAEGVPPEGSLCIEPEWNPQMAVSRDLTPFTQYQWDGQRFFPAACAHEPMIDKGFLRLGDAGYGVVRVDLDEAVLRVTSFADAVVRQRRQRRGQREPMRLPPLVSNGLTVYRSGWAESVQRVLGAAARKAEALRSDAHTVLYAADLVQGYRIDVWDARSGQWHSLCRRVGRYRFPGAHVVTLEDEGAVPAGASLAPDGQSDDLYVPESLFHWDGWSLVAPRPEEIRLAAAGEGSPESGRLEASFVAAPRSLPRLRFGGVYRIRARAVDLAGNSVSLEEESEGFAHATEPITYGRFEPVDSPMVVLTEEAGPGEALDTMVIRSDVDRVSRESRERHVAPPPVSSRIAEAHGKAGAGAGVAARPFAPDEVHGEAALELPYLPDPVARGVALRGLPGVPPGEVVRVSFGDLPWPDALPFRLRVEEGAGLPLWDEEHRVLTAYLDKGQTAKVKLSAYMAPEDLGEMGLWQWLEEGGLPEARLASLKKMALEGLHWMLTPYRELTLIHAVRQPLAPPAWKAPSFTQAPGQSFVTLLDRVSVHGRTTDRLAVEAVWEEAVREPGRSGGQVLRKRALIADVPVEPDDSSVLLKSRHEFGDQRYHKVEYNLVAHSRFAALFPDGPAAGTLRYGGHPLVQEVLSSARPPAPAVAWAEALTDRPVWRVYLEPPWYASGDGELLGIVPAEGGPVASAHEVHATPGGGLWWADLPATAGQDGDRWNLVRYQPRSLPGLHLSAATPVSAAALAGGYTLTVLPGAMPEEADLVVAGEGSGDGPPAEWIVTVERQGPAGWEPFGPTPAALAPAESGRLPAGAWSGSVLVPSGGAAWRLVLEARGVRAIVNV